MTESSTTPMGAPKVTQRFHCTTCPSECTLTVEVASDEAGCARAISVHGNRCGRGRTFAEQEVSRPMRVLTTTVLVKGGDERLLPVRTARAIPRDMHLKAMEDIRRIDVEAPVRMGDVVLGDLMGSGVDLVASMDVDAI